MLAFLAGISMQAQEADSLALSGAVQDSAEAVEGPRQPSPELVKMLRDGNKAFKEQRYQDALRNFSAAAELDSTSFPAQYDRALVLGYLERYQEAAQVLGNLAGREEVQEMQDQFQYDLATAELGAGQYGQAVQLYREYLLNHPQDREAKENYAYAKLKLKEQQDQNQDQNKDQQDQNNKDQQNQNQDQNKDQQNQNQDQNQDRNDNRQNQQPQGGQQPQLSPQAAQQMLQAMQAQEKKTQDKVKKAKAEKMARKQKQKTKNW